MHADEDILDGRPHRLEPGMIDLNGISPRVHSRPGPGVVGWAYESADRIDGVRLIEVAPLGTGEPADREQVVATAKRVVSEDRRFTGRHRLVFPSGEEVELGIV